MGRVRSLTAASLAGAALVAGAGLAACDGEEDGRSAPDRRSEAKRPERGRPQDSAGRERGTTERRADVVRAWIAALNARDYRRAAAAFAPRAVVQQGLVFRLRDRRAAEAFNRGLPCRGELTRLENEGATLLGTFRLSAGPGGPCDGMVQVRFTVRRGRFREWRQLPTRRAAPVPGEPA